MPYAIEISFHFLQSCSKQQVMRSSWIALRYYLALIEVQVESINQADFEQSYILPMPIPRIIKWANCKEVCKGLLGCLCSHVWILNNGIWKFSAISSCENSNYTTMMKTFFWLCSLKRKQYKNQVRNLTLFRFSFQSFFFLFK